MRPIEIIKPPSKLSLNLPELWSYRELFYFFTWRDIKVKYKQTFLGFLWAILQPLMMMGLFTLLFSKLLRFPPTGISYPIYALSGLLIWNIFSSGLTNAADSMVSHGHMIKKIYFPRLIIPVSALLVALFDFLMAFIVFLILLPFFESIPSWPFMIFCTLIALSLVFLVTVGAGCLFAALNVLYRDFRYLIPFGIQLLFFLNPVIYSRDFFSHPLLNAFFDFNPIAAAMDVLRTGITGGELDGMALVTAYLSAGIIFIIGIWVFRKMESHFADLV